jgi:hypothetical protein
MENKTVYVVCPEGEWPKIYVGETFIIAAADTGPVGFQHNTEAHNPVFEALWHNLSKAIGGSYVILHVVKDGDIVDTIRRNKAFCEEERMKMIRRGH